MCLRLAWVLFALGILAAGCGGGGGSHIVPTTGSNPGAPNAPTTAKTTHASISLYVPPANKQNARSKPFYISPNTQSFGVFVEAYPSAVPSIGPSSSPPPGIQIFPVTTPSPCEVATGGGYTCTLIVTAPVGNDLFIVAAFAGASPNPNTAPLSAFVSGPISVSLSPSPSATPLSFTLNGIVNSVAVAVHSPDPGNTPNTQVFTELVPTSAPLAITAYDSTGNIVMSPATQPFFNPIDLEVSPASDGLTLALIGSPACDSSASGASAQINCVGDLGNVQVSYDGTPRPDANGRLIDAYAVFSTNAPNPTPSPANFVLASNIKNYQLVAGLGVAEPSYIMRTSSGTFVYLANSTSGWELGTFAPATGTSTAPVVLAGASAGAITSAAMALNGDVWVDNNGPLDCYHESGGEAVVSGLYPVTSTGDAIYPTAITIDTAGNLWYAGYDNSGDAPQQMYTGFFNVSQGCSSTIPGTITASFTLSGDVGPDYGPLSALPGGGVAMATATQSASGIYLMQTTSPSTLSIVPAILGPQPFSYGVAGDNAGNVYAGFYLYSGSALPDIEKLASGGTALSTLLAIPPNPSPAPLPAPVPSGGLNAFSVSGAADRMMYADRNYAALGLVESVASSPMPILVSLPNAAIAYGTVYSSNGGEYALNTDGTGNLNLTRVLATRTWSVANVAMYSGCNSSGLLSILERGDSGPFTVSAPSGITVTALPGSDHDYWLSGLTSGTPFTASVRDAHGRTESFNVTPTASFIVCGLAHRPHKRV